jgi:hypothetical protein
LLLKLLHDEVFVFGEDLREARELFDRRKLENGLDLVGLERLNRTTTRGLEKRKQERRSVPLSQSRRLAAITLPFHSVSPLFQT